MYGRLYCFCYGAWFCKTSAEKTWFITFIKSNLVAIKVLSF